MTDFAAETITRSENHACGTRVGRAEQESGKIGSRACRETLSVATARSICHREGNVRGVHARGASFGQVGGNVQRKRAKRFVDIYATLLPFTPDYRSPPVALVPAVSAPLHVVSSCPRSSLITNLPSEPRRKNWSTYRCHPLRYSLPPRQILYYFSNGKAKYRKFMKVIIRHETPAPDGRKNVDIHLFIRYGDIDRFIR